MKKVCGYKSIDGSFYENKAEAEVANIDCEIGKLHRQLDALESTIVHKIYRKNDWLARLIIDHAEDPKHCYRRVDAMRKAITEHILEDTLRYVLSNEVDIIEDIRNQREKLSSELDKLKKSKRNYWWLAFKWW
jgi:hypothetical protein